MTRALSMMTAKTRWPNSSLCSAATIWGEGQNVRMAKKWALVQVSAYNMWLISRICIKGIAGYNRDFSCDYHSLILIVQHKASETNWFNDFQDTDTILKLSFIEVGTNHYTIAWCCLCVMWGIVIKCGRLYHLGLRKYTLTFAQWKNRLTKHFSERIWLNQLSNTTNLWWIDVYYLVINYMFRRLWPSSGRWINNISSYIWHASFIRRMGGQGYWMGVRDLVCFG